MCNSILISPLDRFCGGTGGTGGTAQDFGASRWYRRVGPVGTGVQGDADRVERPSWWSHRSHPSVPPKVCRTACSTTGTTSPTR